MKLIEPFGFIQMNLASNKRQRSSVKPSVSQPLLIRGTLIFSLNNLKTVLTSRK